MRALRHQMREPVGIALLLLLFLVIFASPAAGAVRVSSSTSGSSSGQAQGSWWLLPAAPAITNGGPVLAAVPSVLTPQALSHGQLVVAGDPAGQPVAVAGLDVSSLSSFSHAANAKTVVLGLTVTPVVDLSEVALLPQVSTASSATVALCPITDSWMRGISAQVGGAPAFDCTHAVHAVIRAHQLSVVVTTWARDGQLARGVMVVTDGGPLSVTVSSVHLVLVGHIAPATRHGHSPVGPPPSSGLATLPASSTGVGVDASGVSVASRHPGGSHAPRVGPQASGVPFSADLKPTALFWWAVLAGFAGICGIAMFVTTPPRRRQLAPRSRVFDCPAMRALTHPPTPRHEWSTTAVRGPGHQRRAGPA